MRKDIVLGIALALSSTAALAAGSTFSALDSDGDNSISKDEFYGSVSDWGTYSDWDTSGDGLIDDDEFNTLVADRDVDWDYATWDLDGDGYLDSGEFYDGIYTVYDYDEDGYWQNGEWHDAGEAGLWDV
ncbi:EF-hand domain-containing protein [Kushneria sp. AK178]